MDLDNKIATRESFGKALVELGKENKDVVVLTADLAGATKTSLFEKEFPAVVPVQNIQQGEADGRAEKPVQRMQHRVPVGEGDVVCANLAHDLRRINKQQDDDFEGVWQCNI